MKLGLALNLEHGNKRKAKRKQNGMITHLNLNDRDVLAKLLAQVAKAGAVAEENGAHDLAELTVEIESDGKAINLHFGGEVVAFMHDVESKNEWVIYGKNDIE